MKRKVVLSLIVAVVSLGTTNIWAQSKKPRPIVAVFQIESQKSSLSKDELTMLTDYLSTKLGERGVFQIIPSKDIRRVLLDQKKESYKSCYDNNCQIEIGRELAAQYLVSSKIGRFGRQCLITSGLFDLQKAATVITASGKGSCNPEKLLTVIEEIAEKFERAFGKVDKPPVVQPEKKPEKTVSYQPEKQPDAVPASVKQVQQTKSNWASGASVTGFIGSAVVLGLAVGAEITADDQIMALSMGGAATALFATLLPIVNAGGASARESAGVDGKPTLRTIGWISYGVGLAAAAALIGMSLAETEIPPGMIASAGGLGTFGLILFSIDALASSRQADEKSNAATAFASERQSWQIAPLVSPVILDDGSVGAVFGLAGRF
jgi:hypothetical protein